MAGAREWLLLTRLAQHPDAPIVLELGALAAADDLAVQLLLDTTRVLQQAGRDVRIEGDPPPPVPDA